METDNPNFTPTEGEWIADVSIKGIHIRQGDSGRTIAIIKHCPTHTEYVSNGRIIMNAKRMLTALTILLAYHDSHPSKESEILIESIRKLVRQIDRLPPVEGE